MCNVCCIFCWCLRNNYVFIVVCYFVFVFYDFIFFVFVCEIILVCCYYGVFWLEVYIIKVFIVNRVSLRSIMVY